MVKAANHAQQRQETSLIAGALLLLTAMCVQLSFGPAYLVRLQQVRQDMRMLILNGLSENQITTLHLPVSRAGSIDWLDGGMEVRVDGRMFDIVSLKGLSDGSVVIKAVRDDQEGHVLAALDRSVRLHIGQDAQGKERGARFISAWAAYCMEFARLNILAPPVADRPYGDEVHHLLGIRAEVDPLPPRIS